MIEHNNHGFENKKKKKLGTKFVGKLMSLLAVTGGISTMNAAPPSIEERLEIAQKGNKALVEENETLSVDNQTLTEKLLLEQEKNKRLSGALDTLPKEFQKNIEYSAGEALDGKKIADIFDKLISILADKKILSQDDYDDLRLRALKNPNMVGWIILGLLSAFIFGIAGSVTGLAGGYMGVKAGILKIKKEVVDLIKNKSVELIKRKLTKNSPILHKNWLKIQKIEIGEVLDLEVDGEKTLIKITQKETDTVFGEATINGKNVTLAFTSTHLQYLVPYDLIEINENTETPPPLPII